MTEQATELSKRLVVGHKCDGRSCYDRDAKRELIEASLQPGVSVARMALLHGINANLLRSWIRRYQLEQEDLVGAGALVVATDAVAVRSAFVPVVQAKTPAKLGRSSLGALLPNGVRLELSELGPDELPTILRLLAELPCFGSTPG